MIEVTVSPKGEVTVQTKGYTGGDCVPASQFLERTLGVCTNDRKTPEYFETTAIQQSVERN
jgi:hypothetical protein